MRVRDVCYKNKFESALYVLTNKYQNRGAVGMLRTDLLEKFVEWGGCDLYILPNSIHEGATRFAA